MLRSSLPLGFLLILAASAAAADLHVPGDFATIQRALDASADGDVVHVAPGVWTGNLVVPAHALTLVSDGGASVTTIDATGSGTSAVLFVPSPAARLLRGFTITGGQGSPYIFETFPGGGGVLGADSADTEVRDCVITGNSAVLASPPAGSGGGIILPLGRVVGCTIENNVSNLGGGIASAGLVKNCLVRHNTAGQGGGIATSSVIVDTIVEENVATALGGGLYGGTSSASSGVIVRNNTAPGGAGMYVANFAGVTVYGCTFTGNTATGNGGAAWLHVGSTPLPVPMSIERCVFFGNATGGASGGDVYCDGVSPHPLTVKNCTFVGETLVHAQGFQAQPATLNSTIILDVPGWHAGLTGPTTVSWCDVPGGSPGPGNIDAYPFFADAAGGDWSLLPGSPCIDTGDPGAPLDPDGTRADMGAVPFHPWKDVGFGLAGVQGTPSLAGTGSLLSGSSTTLAIEGAAPLAPAVLVMGASPLFAPFKGGTMVPHPFYTLDPLTLDGDGALLLEGAWPAGIPSGFQTWFQLWLLDGAGPVGWSATNGLRATTR